MNKEYCIECKEDIEDLNLALYTKKGFVHKKCHGGIEIINNGKALNISDDNGINIHVDGKNLTRDDGRKIAEFIKSLKKK